jgi:hypothetical protein
MSRTGVAFALSIVAVGSADALAEDMRVDVGITGASVSVDERNGTGMVTEIKALVGDNMAVGGRVEIAVMFGGVVGGDDLPLDVAFAACGLLKGEMYFGPGPLRPFVGLGAGAYTIGGQAIDDGPNTSVFRSSTGRYVGLAPQIGIDIGRLRLAATYNAILGASLEVHEMGTVERHYNVSQNYLTLELSFAFGRTKPTPPPAPL